MPPTTPPRFELPAAKAVHLRRLYTDCRFGQLHVRSAFPSTGGFDEKRTLICLHDAGASSVAFRAVLAEFGRDRSVYAPDLPGAGESEVSLPPPGMEGYAAAVADFVDGLRVREFDLLGVRYGSLVAVETALALPARVRHLILAGVPCLSADERRELPLTIFQPPRDDGAHLIDAWNRLRSKLGSATSLEALAAEYRERVRNAEGGAHLAHATLAHASAERLMLVKQPALVLRMKDDLADVTRRGAGLIRGARCIDVDGDSVPLRRLDSVLAQNLRAFLDR